MRPVFLTCLLGLLAVGCDTTGSADSDAPQGGAAEVQGASPGGSGNPDGGGSDPGPGPGDPEVSCAESAALSVSGDYVVEGASAVLTVNHLDTVSVTATHKVDIDHEDQCLSSIEIVLSTLFEGAPACRLTLRGDSSESEDDESSKIVLLGTFEADSFCPGFPDVDEGIYTGYAGTATVTAAFQSAGSEICVQTALTVQLDGSLIKAGDDTRLVLLTSTGFQIQGGVHSLGSTENPCMEGFESSPPTLVCAPNLQRSCPCPGGLPEGVQTCLADGSGWTTCTCDEPTDPPDACAKSAPPSWPCNPYCQTGCPAGQGCTYSGGGGCYPTGLSDMGQQCSGTSCQAGHACLQLLSEQIPICRRFCITDSDCGPDRKCDLTVNGLFTVCSDPAPACVPDCSGSECGPDECGGICGICPADTVCEAGECFCVPDCSGSECGPDKCGGVCGTCPNGIVCEAGECVCVPDCFEKECGSDGCGGSCGTCSEDEYCSDSGSCNQDDPE